MLENELSKILFKYLKGQSFKAATANESPHHGLDNSFANITFMQNGNFAFSLKWSSFNISVLRQNVNSLTRIIKYTMMFHNDPVYFFTEILS